MRTLSGLSLCLAGAALVQESEAQFKASAVIKGSPAAVRGKCPEVSGLVTFEQDTAEGDMTVTVDLKGISPGEHGFHVHQYGDESILDSLESMGFHFIAYCVPNLDNPEEIAACSADSTHGFPPSQIRQSGDMGNLTAGEDCTIKTKGVFGQKKMSLSEARKSIIGRAILIHEKADDGSAPWGNAGSVYAFGVIGRAQGTQETIPVSLPSVTKTHCRFTKSGSYAVEGRALFNIVVSPSKQVQSTLQLTGLTSGSKHALHFTAYGDVTNEPTSLGGLLDLSSKTGVKLETIQANEKGEVAVRFSNDGVDSAVNLGDIVGRALVIRKTEDPNSEIIGRAVCGFAEASSKISLPGDEDSDSPSSASSYVLSSFLLALSVFFRQM